MRRAGDAAVAMRERNWHLSLPGSVQALLF